MADSNQLGVSPINFVAGGAIGINRMVKLDTTTNRVIATTAITDVAIGTALQPATAAGDSVPVQVFGKVKVVAGDGSVTVGAQLMPQASQAGKVITAAGATAKSCAIALQASGADGDTIEALIGIGNVNGIANS